MGAKVIIYKVESLLAARVGSSMRFGIPMFQRFSSNASCKPGFPKGDFRFLSPIKNTCRHLSQKN